MLTIEDASHILTEFGIQADPFTVSRWIHEGRLRGERVDNTDVQWRVSQESLNRLIRRLILDLRRQYESLRHEVSSLLGERDSLRNQLADTPLRTKPVQVNNDEVEAYLGGELPF